MEKLLLEIRELAEKIENEKDIDKRIELREKKLKLGNIYRSQKLKEAGYKGHRVMYDFECILAKRKLSEKQYEQQRIEFACILASLLGKSVEEILGETIQ